MENSVPKAQKPRFVKCPKCWNLLQEVDDVPVYRCGVCDTMLQAKHSKKRHDVESPPAPSDFGDQRNSENGAPNLTVEPSTPGLNSEENLENGGNRDDETKECLGEKLGANLNLGKDESEMLSSEEKKEEEFFGEEKRVVDGTKSNDGISPNYEGSVSSLDERGEDDIGVPQFKEIPGTSEKISFSSTSSSHHEMEDENSLPPSQSQEKLKDVILNRNQPNVMPKGSEDKGSFNLEIPKLTQDIEDDKCFTSPQWNDQDSNEQGRAELLKMVDELRYQLIGKLVQDESDLYSTSSHLQLKGGRHARRRSLRRSMMKMQESEPEFSNHSLAEGLRSSRQNVPNCVHCHALPPPPPLGIFCANGLCTSCCRTYCNSPRSAMSGSGDWQCHISPPNPPYLLRSNSSTSTEDSWFARSERQQPKVRKYHHITKRHCRPIFGGANLIICYRCHKLIQMPDDLLISRSRTNKLRCGVCFKVLTFQIPEDASREEVAGNLFSYYSGGDSGSSSIGNNADRVKRDRRKKEAALHSLMGYSSARDIIFQPSSDED